MKFLVVLLLTCVSFTLAQVTLAQTDTQPAIQTIPLAPAPSTAEQPAEVIPPAQAQAVEAVAQVTAQPVKKVVSTSTAKVKKAEPPKSPWGGAAILEVARATDVNHSKILEPDAPDKRIESSLAFTAKIRYKLDAKNTLSAKQVIEHDIVKNPAAPTDNDYNVKNLSLAYSHKTDMTLFGSEKVTVPLIIGLPTAYKSRSTGMIGSIGLAPQFDWTLNPIFSLNLSLFGAFTAKSDVAEEYSYDKVMAKSTITLSNYLTLSANVSDKVSISQTLGVTSKSENYQNLGSADQLGAQLEVSSGLSYAMTPSFTVDVSVNQVAPMQGTGFGTKVYESNTFRLYHVAQTSYGLAGTLNF